jgi:hypothetical protein
MDLVVDTDQFACRIVRCQGIVDFALSAFGDRPTNQVDTCFLLSHYQKCERVRERAHVSLLFFGGHLLSSLTLAADESIATESPPSSGSAYSGKKFVP